MVASIRLEDRLDGISNYLQWKVRMTTIFKENKLWALVTTVVVPPSNDPIALDIHEVKEAKAQRLILDGVKDPLIPHLAEKKTAKEMWEALKNLYEAKNENHKMALKDKLHSIKMTKGESVVPYLTRLAQVKDELAAVGEVISDSELVRIALKGFTKDWEVFVKCIANVMVGGKDPPGSRPAKVPLVERPPFSLVQASSISLPLAGVSASILWDFSPMEVRVNHLPICTYPSGMVLQQQKVCLPWAHKS
jgi:hypothetical protein